MTTFGTHVRSIPTAKRLSTARVTESASAQVSSRSQTVRTLPYLLAVVFSVAYAIVSINRHRQLRTGAYDLGIFEQAIKSYAHFRAPVSEIKGPGFPLLGDHFHPILAVLGPFYWAFPSPITLLVAQAMLVAISIIPVTRLALDRLGTPLGLSVGIAYAMSSGLQNAIGFDFHEISFAVPLLAFAVVRLAERRWVAAVAFAAPLVLVKEDLPLTVAMIGVYLFFARQRWLGIIVATASAVTGALIMLVIIPALNIYGQNAYLTSVNPSKLDPIARLFDPMGVKGFTLLMLLLPTAFLALRSPLLMLVVPTLLWRFWSTTYNYWGPHFHYDAVLMPIIFVSFIDALTRLRPIYRGWLRYLPAVAVVVSLGVTANHAIKAPLSEVVRPSMWRADSRVHDVRQLLAEIPNGARVAAPNYLASQLVSRTTVYLFPYFPNPQIPCEWALIDEKTGDKATTDEAVARRFDLTSAGQYHQVDAASRVILLHRTR